MMEVMWTTATFALAQIQALVRSERRLEMLGVPSGWAAVACLGLVVGVGFLVVRMYRRESRTGWSLRARTVLAGLRCGVLTTLLVIWMEPVLATYLHRRVEAYALLLADTSASMDLADAYDDRSDAAGVERLVGGTLAETGPRRIDLVKRVLVNGSPGGLIDRLREKNGVKLLAASEDATLVGSWLSNVGEQIAGMAGVAGTATNDAVETGSGLDTLEASGAATDLGRCVERAIESVAGAPIAGLVLLSDGAINRGRSAYQIAAFARTRNIPVYAVGVGDARPPVNLRVRAVEAPQAAFAGDPIAITARVEAHGLMGETIQVRLYVGEEDGGGQVPVAQRSMRVPEEAWSGAVEFEYVATRPGRAILRAEAECSRSEIDDDDNVRGAVMTIQENRARVLLISGGPSWDYRALTRLLERDETTDVSCWLQSASREAVRDGNTIIDHLPQSPRELNEYDAVVMLDPSTEGMPASWGDWLASWVSEGAGGLMYCAGRKYTPRFAGDASATGILEFLPVVMDEESTLILNQLGHYQKNAWPVRIPEASLDHPILRLAESVAGSRAAWERIGRVHWYYPVRHEKPLAAVLMRHGNPQMGNEHGPHVLLAAQAVGAGRTAFLAFDGTWRWRRYGEEYFNRFWIQAVRYLVEGKLSGGRRRADLRVDRDTVQLGEAVRVTGRFLDEQFAPLVRGTVPVVVSVEGHESERAELLRSVDRAGWYDTTLIPRRTGAYELRVELRSEAGQETVEDRTSFLVVKPNLEMTDPRLNREALQAIGEGSGGGYFELDEWEQIPGLLRDRHEELVVAGRPQPLWDGWHTLCLLGGLLAVEWALRKKARLL